MMFAVIKTGGKQYRVSADDVLKVEKIAGEPGEIVQFGEVLMVGGDSIAMGTPTVAIFGPTVPALGFGPLAQRHSVAGINLDCRPCHAHGPQECPLGHWKCMRELTVQRVADAVLAVSAGAPFAISRRDAP